MTEKQLLTQLKSLKNVCLDCDTKSSNRNVLFSQISAQRSDNFNAEKAHLENNAVMYFRNFVLLISRPALVVAGVFVFIFGATIFASGFYKNSKPNDTSYIARIISEKAKLNTTFSQAEREALALKFAVSNARDIAEVLMDPEFNTEANKVKVEKLNANLRTEISKVKNQMDQRDSKNALAVKSETTKTDDQIVQSATSITDENGLEIYMGEKTSSSDPISEPVAKDATSSEAVVDLSNIEKLSTDGQFSQVIDKLTEVQNLIK